MSPHRRLLKFKQLLELGISFSREHVRRLECAGKFPKRLRLSPQKIAWFENEILAWVAERDAERNAPGDDNDEYNADARD
jgi:prophage regulatory protein